MRTIVADRVLGWAVLGNTYLFFLATLLQLTIIIYGNDVLHVDDTHITDLLTVVAIGIGIGSVAAGYLSGGKIEYGLSRSARWGCRSLARRFTFERPRISWRTGRRSSYPRIPVEFVGDILSIGVAWARLRILELGFLGFFGGLFAVPLAALMQHRPTHEDKGDVMAAANLVSFMGIRGHRAPTCVHGYFSSNVGRYFARLRQSSLWSQQLVPSLAARFAVALCALGATHSIYRIRVVGRENIPAKGGALFVSQSSFVRGRVVCCSRRRTAPSAS